MTLEERIERLETTLNFILHAHPKVEEEVTEYFNRVEQEERRFTQEREQLRLKPKKVLKLYGIPGHDFASYVCDGAWVLNGKWKGEINSLGNFVGMHNQVFQYLEDVPEEDLDCGVNTIMTRYSNRLLGRKY